MRIQLAGMNNEEYRNQGNPVSHDHGGRRARVASWLAWLPVYCVGIHLTRLLAAVAVGIAVAVEIGIGIGGRGLLADELQAAEEPVIRPAAELLAAGDKLAAEKKYDEALLLYKEAYEIIVPELRNLPFREPVTPRLMFRSELKDYMAAELAKEIPPPLMKQMDRSLKVLGLVPESLDVRETLLNLYTEEVGGFYNPRTKEMFLIREDPVKRSILTRWLKGPEFDTQEQRVTLAHEMTHALADQHFDLVGLDRATEGNDDVSIAVSSLIEGEATLIMLGELLGIDATPELLADMQPERIDAMFKFLNWVAPFLSGRTMRNAPPIFRQSLIFPYHKGTVFASHLTNQGGWSAINLAFREPPLSTEQILHPEKYLGPDPDWPTAIELPQLASCLDNRWTGLGGNTLGELQLQILLDKIPGALQAAAGWDGDRYEVFERDDGHLGLAWFSTWDSPEDAREFAIASSQYFAGRQELGNESSESLRARCRDAFPQTDATRGAFRRTDGETNSDSPALLVEWRGADVAILWGFSEPEVAPLEDLIWQSQKAPLRIER